MTSAPPAAMNHGKDAGYKKERGESGENEAADDGATQRGVLLAAFTKADGHGDHADDHGQRRHENGANTDKPRLERGLTRALAFSQLFLREGDQQDAVRRG